MKRKAINPPGMYDSVKRGFSHAVEQNGGRTLYLAGQVSLNAADEIVGPGDLVAQTRQALANLKMVLEAAGAAPADILRLRTYVVDHSPEKLRPVMAEIIAFFGDAEPSANTLIGVQALALPDYLVEIEATAVL